MGQALGQGSGRNVRDNLLLLLPLDQLSVRDQEATKSAWRYAFHFTRSAHNLASIFVNKTKTTLRAHTADKNTSFVCGRDLRFWMAAVLFLAIYRDTVPLTGSLQKTS